MIAAHLLQHCLARQCRLVIGPQYYSPTQIGADQLLLTTECSLLSELHINGVILHVEKFKCLYQSPV